jgi:hypothetical protein
MKTFKIRVTQNLTGYYEGTIEIEASNEKAALNKLKKMSKKDIDEQADWRHGDQYDGDKDSIEIDETEINELI